MSESYERGARVVSLLEEAEPLQGNEIAAHFHWNTAEVAEVMEPLRVLGFIRRAKHGGWVLTLLGKRKLSTARGLVALEQGVERATWGPADGEPVVTRGG